MGTYNPHSPYVLGMQWPPVNRDQVLLDSSVEVGYSFRAVVDRGSVDGISMVRLLTTMPPAGRAERQELVAAISRAGRVGGTGPIRKVVIGCREGEHVSGSSTVPVSAVHEAVRSPADGSYVRLTGPDAGTRFWFDTAAVLPELAGRRILDVTVLYSITGPFVEYPGGVTIGMERPSVGSFWVMDDSVTGAAVSTGQSQIYRARLGELSPYGLASDMNPDSTTTRLPWHHLILADMHASGGNLNVRVSTSGTVSGGVEFDIQYVALEVTYCEETREAAGGLDIGMAGGPQLAAGGRLWYYDIPVFDTRYLDYGASVDRGDEYVVTIGRAYSGSTLGQSATPIPVDRLGSLDPFVSHQGVVVRKALREGASHQVEQTDLMPAAVLLADGSADAGSHAYVTQRPAALHFDNAGSFTQLLSGDGAGTYVWGRFYARRAEGTNQPLSLFQVPVDAPSTPPSDDAITYVTPDEVDRLPELVNGWRDVIVRLAQPVVIEDGETTRWRFRSLTNAASPWEVLGADTDPGSLDGLDLGAAVSYGGVQAHADFESEDDSSADLVLSLAREMDTVTGLVVVEQVQPLMVVDPDCVVPVDGIPTGIHYHRLTWEPVNSEVVAGWGSYEVQRQDDTMGVDDWELIASMSSPWVSAMDDFEARVGVESRYRIRMVHQAGFPGPWSTEVTARIPVPGVTGTRTDTGLLIMTSNHDPDGNLAYVHTTDRVQPEDFTFREGGRTDLQTMYGRDYRVAFRPTERLGTEFTRTVMVNAAGVPQRALDRGFTGLRDLAWDALPYVCVRDETAGRWLSTVSVPSGSVQRVLGRGHVMLARVNVVEVTTTPEPVAVSSCEGLAATATVAEVNVRADAPAAIVGVLEQQDDFNRVEPAGWGDPSSGTAWSVVGAVADYTVDGTYGVHHHTSLTEARRSYTGSLLDGLTTVLFRPSALPTGSGARAEASVFQRETADGQAHYRLEASVRPNGVVGASITVRVDGNDTVLASGVADGDGVISPERGVWLELEVRGIRVDGRVWFEDTDRPGSPTLSVESTTDVAEAGAHGFRSHLNSSVTNPLPYTFFADSYEARALLRDLEVRMLVCPTGHRWAMGVGQTFGDASGEYRYWQVIGDEVEFCGVMSGLDFFNDCVDTAETGPVINQRRWVRWIYQGLDGDASRMTFEVSDDGDTWTVVQSTTGSFAPFQPSAERMFVFAEGDVTVLQTIINAGVDGPTIMSPNFAIQPAGTTQFVDEQGNSWKLDFGAICGQE